MATIRIIIYNKINANLRHHKHYNYSLDQTFTNPLASSRSTRLKIFPVGFLGISLIKITPPLNCF